MNLSVYDKKTWLKNHIEEILELQKNGLKQQQIIDALKQSYDMPFEIEKSLFSRHLKSLITETQLEQDNQHKQVHNQTLRTRFKQQQQLQKQLTEKQEALNVLQNQLEFQQIEAENKRLQKLLTQYQADDQKKTQTLLKTQKESKQRLYLALSFVFLTIFFLILNIFRC